MSLILEVSVSLFQKILGEKSDFGSHLPSPIFDPLGRPTVPARSDHYFCTLSPSVRPHFSKYQKTKQTSLKIIIATGGTVGLAEGIIDDICLVSSSSFLRGRLKIKLPHLKTVLFRDIRS